jgi:hypothetical protein
MADSHIRKFFPDYDPDEPGWTLINQASKISEAFAYEDEIKETSYKLLEILIPLQQALAKLAQRHFGETVNESVSLQNKIISELISMARQKHIKDFQKNWYHDRIMLTSGSIVKLKEQTTKACEEVDKALKKPLSWTRRLLVDAETTTFCDDDNQETRAVFASSTKK